MKKYICILSLIVGFTLAGSTVKAQKASDKIFYGGGIGLSFQSNYYMFNISPMVGYRFTPSFSGGVSALYSYENYKKRNPDFTINSYGGGAFLRYDLGPALMQGLPFSIFFQGDYEGRQENIKYKNMGSTQFANQSNFENRLFLGAGYYQPLGGRLRAYAMISVDMLHLSGDNKVKPLIRAGIEF